MTDIPAHPPRNDDGRPAQWLCYTDYQTVAEYWETDMPGAVPLLEDPEEVYAGDTGRAAEAAAEMGAIARGAMYPRAVWALLYAR